VERCTSSGRRKAKECVPGASPQWGPRGGACRGPMARSRATNWRWAGLEPAKRSRRLTLKVAAASAPQPFRATALQAPAGEAGRAGSSRGRLEQVPPVFPNRCEGLGIRIALAIFDGNKPATANKMVRRGNRPALFPAPPLGHHAQRQPNVLILWGDDHRPEQPQLLQRWPAMGYQTPNIDRWPKEGASSIHYYASRAASAVGSLILRPGVISAPAQQGGVCPAPRAAPSAEESTDRRTASAPWVLPTASFGKNHFPATATKHLADDARLR